MEDHRIVKHYTECPSCSHMFDAEIGYQDGIGEYENTFSAQYCPQCFQEFILDATYYTEEQTKRMHQNVENVKFMKRPDGSFYAIRLITTE